MRMAEFIHSDTWRFPNRMDLIQGHPVLSLEPQQSWKIRVNRPSHGCSDITGVILFYVKTEKKVSITQMSVDVLT